MSNYVIFMYYIILLSVFCESVTSERLDHFNISTKGIQLFAILLLLLFNHKPFFSRR